MKFRTAGAWGAGEGRNLFPAEVDENFHEVDERLDELETNPPAANNIASITVVGNVMRIIMADASEFGPFTLPVDLLRWRDVWAPSTEYDANDLFYIDGLGLYIVLVDHTSASTFDAEATADDTDLSPLYHLLIGIPALNRDVVDINIGDTAAIFGTDELLHGSYVRIDYDNSSTEPSGGVLEFTWAEPNDSDVGHEVRFRQVGAFPISFTDPFAQLDVPTGKVAMSAFQGAVVWTKLVVVDVEDQSNTVWELWGDLADEVTA